MCGIVGFLGPWQESMLAEMVVALKHRGPDGEGVVFDQGAGFGLGHTRLAIIDLSDGAAQPMNSPDGRFVLSFNGEIYNYGELRRGLREEGVEFVTESDSEVLLQLFIKRGPACLDHLSGIFAFAVWDRADRRLFLARDHLGVKPLYYAPLECGFLFASELKVLTLCPDLPRDIDSLAVADHMGFLWTAGEATMLRSVRKLRPGHAITLDSAGLKVERYYRTPLPDSGSPPVASRPEKLRALIDEIVSDQMVADVEVGALLSGGVDSSAIVASMCRATEPSRITTFCAAVPKTGGSDNFGDDHFHARRVADRLGVGLIEVPTEANLIESLSAMVWALDEPTADFSAVQTLMLARAARENRIKVLLSGIGGDDLFTGYGRHTAGLLAGRLDHVPGTRALVAAVLARFSPATLVGRRLERIGQLLAMEDDDMLVEAMSYSAVTAPVRRALLAPDRRAETPADGMPGPLRKSVARTKGLDPVIRMLDLELNGFLPDHNLNYTDKMAMAAGVEVRVPLVDRRLVEFGMAVPLRQKISLRRTKKILRDSQSERLPRAVLTRPKQGFGVPVRAWLQGPARPLLEDVTADSVIRNRGLFDPAAVAGLKRDFFAKRVDAAFTLFPLMAIELWCRALDTAPASVARAAAS